MVCPVCKIRSSERTGVRMPEGGPRFERWVESLNLTMTEEERKAVPKNHYYVCFSHFREQDQIIENDVVVGDVANAVPCITFVPKLRKLNDPDAPEFLLVEKKKLEQLFRYCYKCV